MKEKGNMSLKMTAYIQYINHTSDQNGSIFESKWVSRSYLESFTAREMRLGELKRAYVPQVAK